ncbi:iron ABC transporter permease [Staphylococcus lugdunensis]|uniref:FecCD family ABC transporter permease n=1 Tax=Staphylococcus lugdunensis TaxID=28035 RepID=UPI001F4CF483|nr:iron ABC transporter permease [Staphylococcus lugdunensis]MCH8647062.1 iron ABC transporter permease [Staphylococcus lugdunensis]
MKGYQVVSLWLVLLCLVIGTSLLWNLGSILDQFNQMILLKVRIPRVLEALIAGAVLTVAGQLFQIVLNNPLADSFTLGLASGATFGAALPLFIGISVLWIPVFSIGTSMLTLILVLAIVYTMAKQQPMRLLIITGLMIGALFNALLYILILIKPKQLNNVANYMFGGFATAEFYESWIMLVVCLPLLLCLFIMIPRIKLLQVGDLKGQSLGLNVTTLTFYVLIIASMMSAIVIAYVGIIGFIGMIIPQLSRRIHHRYSLYIQMILNIIIGGAMMVITDWLGAIIIAPVQIPASIILAIIGIPVLFLMLIKSARFLR